MNVRLGQKVRDVVTGFTGIATSRTEFLAGCVRLGVQAKQKKDGTVPDSQIFDQEQLEILDAKPIRLPVPDIMDPAVAAPRARTGGDRPDPVQRAITRANASLSR